MISRFIIPICLIWSTPVMATSLNDVDIREVQTDSTDIFKVLAILKDAQFAWQERDYISAKQGFESVLLHDPNLEEARRGLRQTLIALGEYEAAVPYMVDPDSADGIVIRVNLEEFEEPSVVLLETLKTNSDPRLWTLLGKWQDSNGAPNAARQSYAMAGLAGARAGLAENNIGQSYWMTGEYDQALQAFEKAVAADPSDRLFDNNRRRALVRLGQTHEAISELSAKRASVFLDQAGDQAVLENEIDLARFMYKKSLELTPRHNPWTAAKLERLEQ